MPFMSGPIFAEMTGAYLSGPKVGHWPYLHILGQGGNPFEGQKCPSSLGLFISLE
jgi:hypothetical protein